MTGVMTDPAERAPLATRAARVAAGKALRNRVSRESLGDFKPAPGRDPLAILAASDPGRVQALVPERYKRMAVSPFAFFRGAAAIMARDLAPAPHVGATVQACGDCHLMNFGAFLTPEGRVLFDINDFDETYPGVDFTVDLKRLAASIVVAGHANGMPDKKALALARATVEAYRAFMAALAGRAPLDVWRVSIALADEMALFDDADLKSQVLAKLAKAEKSARPADDFPGFETRPDGVLAIVDKPPTIFHHLSDGEPVDRVLNPASLARYSATLPPDRRLLLERYGLRDVAFKVVGVGSVGTYCAVALLATADGEPLILQLKQASTSVIAGLAPVGFPPAHHGQRVVDGQRALQAASDPFLGWLEDHAGRQFYLRQLKNRRLGSLAEVMESRALSAYAILCGRTLARAHARTGDPAVITGYCGGGDVLDDAIARFALAYARQTGLDHAALLASPLAQAR